MRIRLVASLVTLLGVLALATPASAAPKKTTVKFSSPTYSVVEGNTSVNLIVQRSGNTSVTTTAFVAKSGGTADASLYTFTSPATVTFDPGQASKTVAIQIHDNVTAAAGSQTLTFQ